MAFRVKVTFDDDTELTTGYKLSDLVRVIKKSPLCGKRSPMPVLPWLIDLGIDQAQWTHRRPIKRIDIEEKVTI